MKLNLTNFYGTVVCTQFHKVLSGVSAIGYTGNISIIHSDDVVEGRTFTGKDANWVARISGEKNTVNILGCQIHAIHTHDKDQNINGDFYVVE